MVVVMLVGGIQSIPASLPINMFSVLLTFLSSEGGEKQLGIILFVLMTPGQERVTPAFF